MTDSIADNRAGISEPISVAIKAAEAAGAFLAQQFRQLSAVEAKGAHDLVTQVDRDAEQLILDCLKAYFPTANYVAEESDRVDVGNEYTWYIDPLDGTSNFVTGNPYFSVSIALAYRGQVIVGVVYNPITEELYTAEQGNGAFLVQGKEVPRRIGVSQSIALKDSLVATAYAADEASIAVGIDRVRKLALATRKTLINFSPALDLCNVARGRLDALVDAGTTPEDHAAGSLIVSESGGAVRNFGARLFEVETTGIVATNSYLDTSLSSFDASARDGFEEKS